MGVYIYNTHIHYPATHTYTCVYRYIYIYTCMGCGWRSSAGSSSGPNCLPRFKLPKSWRRLNPQNNARVLRMLHWYTISRWYIEIDKIGRYKIDTRNKSFWKTTRTSAFTRKVVKQLLASHWFDGLPNRCRTILVSLQFWTAGVQKKPWKTSGSIRFPHPRAFQHTDTVDSARIWNRADQQLEFWHHSDLSGLLRPPSNLCFILGMNWVFHTNYLFNPIHRRYLPITSYY